LIEFVKNYIARREFLCHHQQPYPHNHITTKTSRNLNLIIKEKENKSDYEDDH